MQTPSDIKERLRASYNSMAPEYNKWTERHHYLRLAYLDELLTRQPELASTTDGTHNVLELGSGAGKPFLDILLLKAPSVHAHANDLSDTQMDLARANLAHFEGRVDFHPGDMTKLEFEPESMSAVVALYSLIHLPQEEQRDMMSKIGSWLRPGGLLLANFSAGVESGFIFEHWLHDDGWMFWSGLGKDETIRSLETVGGLKLEKAEIEGDKEEDFLWVFARKSTSP